MLRIGGKTHDKKMFPGIITMMTLLVGLVAFVGVPVMGSLHRVRVDLKIRSPDLLKEKAKAMSKPFPNQGKPLTWTEIIEVTGRTMDEMKDMVATISNDLGGTRIQECPSKQCIVADVDVDDDEILGLKLMNDEKKTQDDVQDLDNVYNHVEIFLERRLRQASSNHRIVKGITRMAMPDDENDWSQERRMGFSLADADDEAKQSAHQNGVFGDITTDISIEREEVTEKALYDSQNYQQFLVIPAICAIDNETGYISMEQEESERRNSCLTEIKVTVSPWYAEDLAVSENLTYTFSTEELEKTLRCSEYNGTTCKNSEELFFPVPANPGGDITIADLYGNATFKFRDDTVLRILDLGQLLDPGVAYYNIEIEYPDFEIKTVQTTAYAYIGPMITPAYGNNRYNVPKGHQGAGIGATALFVGAANVFSEDALAAFLNGFNLPVPDIQLIKSTMFQSNNLTACYTPDGGSCTESDLDVQSITSYGVGAEFGFLPGGQQGPANASDYDNFVSYREAFIQNDFTPDVLSLSWGGPAWSLPEDLDDILMEFTAAGITILVASGDRGAGGDSIPSGIPDSNSPCSPTEYFATVASPASSEWVLAVGATMEADLEELNGLGPAACMAPIGGMITSTGFIYPSDVLELPEYQKKAVEGYMNSDAYQHWPFQPKIDLPGRGIPDVSAYGNNIPYVSEAENGDLTTTPEGGTSASSPAFAGLLLQVRGALLSSPECEGVDVKFGHINPMIYWAQENRPDAFTDITVGNNIFDGQEGYNYSTAFCGQGYVATEGWDPVTGVGHMNFPGFVAAAKEYYCTGI